MQKVKERSKESLTWFDLISLNFRSVVEAGVMGISSAQGRVWIRFCPDDLAAWLAGKGQSVTAEEIAESCSAFGRICCIRIDGRARSGYRIDVVDIYRATGHALIAGIETGERREEPAAGQLNIF